MTAPQQSSTPAPADATTSAASTTNGSDEPSESKTKLAIGMLPDEVKQGLILARQRNVVSAEIASANWGKGLDRDTRFRVAEWSQSVGLDPATELYVLGGNFYKNANYYLRKLSEMIEAGLVEYAYADHVEVDPRLETMAKRTDNLELAGQARAEIDRRTMMRIQYNIPDKAESSVVFHLKLNRVPVEFTAAKWCGGGTRKKDPVGDEFPVETSETRAIRRTLRLVASQNPQFATLVEPNDDDQINATIGPELREGLLKAKREAALAAESYKVKPLMALGAGDGYTSPHTSEVRQPTPEKVLAAASREPDPYQGGSATQPADATIGGRSFAEHNARVDAPVDDGAQDDLDLLSPAERREYEQRKRDQAR